MEEVNSFLSEDHLQCSICLDFFTDPVSVPCGHNFCKACITRHWESKECCQCPLCNKKLSKELKLCVNTVVRDIVEEFKKRQATADNQPQIKPGQVPCDYCIGGKVKASKTCVVCLTSYCQTHLEPHRRVATLKTHTLVTPVHNLEDKICRRHNRILERHCKGDMTQVCVLCSEHSDHDAVEEPHVDTSAQIEKRKVDVQYFKRKRGKKAKRNKVAHIVKPDEMEQIYFWRPPNVGSNRGRVFYELESSGETGCFLGIARESTLQMRTFVPNPRSGSWMLFLLDSNICMAMHDVPVPVFLMRKLKRVRVLVDHDKRQVSFCDVDTMMTIYTFTNCRFNERVFLVTGKIEVSMWQKLRNKIHEIKEELQPRDILLYLLLIFLFICCIFISAKQPAD